MRILITGGTGFLGKHLAEKLDSLGHKVVIFSRSEFKQAEMKKTFPHFDYLLGDIRNQEDCFRAVIGVDLVVHTAALKRIDSCEDNQVVSIDTNINGSINLLNACEKENIAKCILISTDKAYHPHTSYGATKYVAENLFRHWGGYTQGVVIRYGNVIGSTGSVFDIWEKSYKKDNLIHVRSKEMTRFFWGIGKAVDFICTVMDDETVKNLFIPKIDSLNIYEMAKYLYPNSTIRILPESHNEKTHEKMLDNMCSSDNVVSPENHECLNGYLLRR